MCSVCCSGRNVLTNELAEELLRRYRSGQVEALGELVEMYRRPLFGFILSMTEGRDDAEEIFQEVWFKAIRNLSRYKSHSFLSWIFRIAKNLIIDRVRKKKPDRSLQERLGTGENSQELIDSVPDPVPHSQGTQLDNQALATSIKQAVAQLPEEQKEVFLLRTETDMPFKDIARLQKTSINTALARMKYALTKLRELLKDDYVNHQEE